MTNLIDFVRFQLSHTVCHVYIKKGCVRDYYVKHAKFI